MSERIGTMDKREFLHVRALSSLTTAVLLGMLSMTVAGASTHDEVEHTSLYKVATDASFTQRNNVNFFDILFGRSVHKAEAEDWKTLDRSYFNVAPLQTLSAPESARSLQLKDGSPLAFLQESDILPLNEFYRDYTEQLFGGMSYLSYLFKRHTPFSSSFEIPLIFAKEESVHDLREHRYALSNFMLAKQSQTLVENAHERKISLSMPVRLSRTTIRTLQDKGVATERPNLLEVYGFMANDNIALVRDQQYQEGTCSGLGYIEADIKGRCPAPEGQQGLIIATPFPPAVEAKGVFKQQARHLPWNILQPNVYTKGIIEGVRLLGFSSSLSYTRFVDGQEQASPQFGQNLTTFDQHIYNTNKKTLLTPGVRFDEVGKNCSLMTQENCGFYFIGPQVNKLLTEHNDSFSNFALHQDAIIPDSSAYIRDQEEEREKQSIFKEEFEVHKVEFAGQEISLAKEIQEETEAKQLTDPLIKEATYEDSSEEQLEFSPNKRYPLYGIPVLYNEMGMPTLGLRNTLLSYGDYKNYQFLTELEMRMLADLGYNIEPAEFYGTSIYSMGKPQQLEHRYIWRHFGQYNDKKKGWDSKQPSIIPAAVGIHVYGSYNKVTESAMMNLAGAGSLGIRVDGTGNIIRQTPRSVITVMGKDSSGIGFTYGKNNQACIGGVIKATGNRGIAVKVDMGSNVLSDLVEYRGSYLRVRSLDYINGKRTKLQAQSVPLLDDLNGPQVSSIDVSGVLEGRRAAIFIDESSFVKDININKTARIKGGIFSVWHPVWDGENHIFLRHDGKLNELLDGIVQHSRQYLYANPRDFIEQELTTNINLGVVIDNKQQVVHKDLSDEPLADDEANVVLDGDISGGCLNIRQYGASSKVKGIVRANTIDVKHGVLSFQNIEENEAVYQCRNLILRPGTVFDLVDGKPSRLYIQDALSLGRNSVIRLDVDSSGNLLDTAISLGTYNVANYQMTVEPAVSYETLRRLGADPKAMFAFVSNFMQVLNDAMADTSVTVRFPRYIWDNAGGYGREITCTARGCRIGKFVSKSTVTSHLETVEPWRYYLSFGGLFAFVIGFICFYKVRRWFRS